MQDLPCSVFFLCLTLGAVGEKMMGGVGGVEWQVGPPDTGSLRGRTMFAFFKTAVDPFLAASGLGCSTWVFVACASLVALGILDRIEPVPAGRRVLNHWTPYMGKSPG